MPTIGRDTSHHGRLPGPLGDEHLGARNAVSVRGGRRPGPLGANPPSRFLLGGLHLDGCVGVFRPSAERALKEIRGARLPDGSRPVLVGDLEIVQNALTVRTNLTYGMVPLGNKTEGSWDASGHLVIQIQITHLDFIGTKAVAARPAHGGHGAIPGHPALPAMYEDGTPRIFEASLAHEIGHASRIIQRKTFPDFMIEEHLVSNFENQYRYARGIPQRKFYGDVALKQYR